MVEILRALKGLGLATVILVAVFTAIALAGGETNSTSAATELDPEEAEFMAILNDYRADNGLGPIIIDPSLQAAAEWMSNDLGVNNYFSHTDSLGRSPWDRMCDFNYCHNTWKGENIAAGYSTPQNVFQGWKDSPGHNANMLGANYTVMGIARAFVPGSTFGYYWTNDFGGYIAEQSPPPAPTNSPQPTITNSPSPTLTPTLPPASPTPTATPSPTPTPAPTGAPVPITEIADIDCDDQITSTDVLAVLGFLGGIGAANDPGCPAVGEGHGQPQSAQGTLPLHGDVDCNAKVDAMDALGVLRMAGHVTAVGAMECAGS